MTEWHSTIFSPSSPLIVVCSNHALHTDRVIVITKPIWTTMYVNQNRTSDRLQFLFGRCVFFRLLSHDFTPGVNRCERC